MTDYEQETFACVVMTDGRRDHIEAVIDSIDLQLAGRLVDRIIHDDSGDPRHWDWLLDHFGGTWKVAHTAHRRGFGGAYAHAHEHVRRHVTERFVFMTEDDFVIERPVDIPAIMWVLDKCPDIMQMALRRQPWNGAEIAAGGVVETRPECFTNAGLYDDDDPANVVELHWLEHRQFFTTNPSLVRLAMFHEEQPWPNVVGSEQAYSALLLDDHPERVCGYWEARTEPPLVTHVGVERHPAGRQY